MVVPKDVDLEGKYLPSWILVVIVAIISAALSTGLTLTADRASIAAKQGAMEARVNMLEKQAAETYDMHLKILGMLADNATKLQEIADKQGEVRRKLGIER